MKKKIMTVLLLLLFLFLLFQLYQPVPNVNRKQAGVSDFLQFYQVPVRIGNILVNSCYDCHSNNTRYSWYNYIQPVRLLVEKHIASGKRELNFNHWSSYSNRKQSRLLQAIKKQIESREMPLSSYTLLHKNSKLDDAQIKTLVNWLESQK
ncbi:hypothetical protein D3C87_838220 [compost metagenome]|uniref:heme-binding domain-containing protein n=1 Tax=Pedobacter ghigonis TaxID=2730403 RepID=UPI000F9ADC8B|nr:heme-binding domain-containing protein [Pedobacter ghigonis]